MSRTLLPVVQAATNVRMGAGNTYPTRSPDGRERYNPFHLTLQDYEAKLPPIGLLRPQVLQALQAAEAERRRAQLSDKEVRKFSVTLMLPCPSGSAGFESIQTEDILECVYFSDEVLKSGPESISVILDKTLRQWRDEGKFEDVLSSWTNELFQVYYPSGSSVIHHFPPTAAAVLGGPMQIQAFRVESIACDLFCFVTYGVHVMAYEGRGQDMRVWLQKRAQTKATWPGMLDTTVGGGMTAGLTPLEVVVKEANEEASLPADFVRARAVICMFMSTSSDGWLQPEVKYVYDLPLPARGASDYIERAPNDGEAESFASVRQLLLAGEFKPNSGALVVDFMLRHGHLTPETEPNMLEIRWELSRQLGLAVPA